jgi:hypothetical protein
LLFGAQHDSAFKSESFTFCLLSGIPHWSCAKQLVSFEVSIKFLPSKSSPNLPIVGEFSTSPWYSTSISKSLIVRICSESSIMCNSFSG